MSTLNPCCAEILPTQRPLLMRWADDAKEALLRAGQRWSQMQRLHAQQRALEALPASTLRDLGLAERQSVNGPPRIDWERGPW